MWSSWSESATKSLAEALERTGDVISKAATSAGKTAREAAAAHQHPKQDDEPERNIAGRYSQEGSVSPSAADKQQELLKNLHMGWSSVVETTKASMKVAQEKMEEQQSKITEQLKKVRSHYYRRDPKLPLDVEALKDAEVVYLTDRLITMSHPAMASTVNPDISKERKLAAVGHLLQRRHDGRFMVWNLSEVEYDVDILDDQVLTFSFPGSPSPPLGLLLKILISMEAWLKADERNVAVVHCLTGKGRTSTVMAAFLCWMGEAGFSDIYDALAYIAACKQLSPEDLTIPSQRRYASYFKNMLDSVRPSQPPLMLKRIILSEAPRYARGPPREGKEDDEVQQMGCAPYIQIFKAGKLLHTAPASLHFQQDANELPFCQVADGSISFHIDTIVQGDILVRCRHLTSKKQRVSMFRAAFHTGYVPPKVMRLTKSQLDGACSDARFPDDFFMDLIFEPVDAEAASKILLESEESKVSVEHPAVVGATGSEHALALAGGGSTVRASAYDTMLHRDSRFWDVIAARREQHAKDVDKESDPMFGHIVGRRRQFRKESVGAGNEPKSPDESIQANSAFSAFSIGGEFDFLPESVEPETGAMASTPTHKDPPKIDTLMEALMGALDDEEEADDGIEEIVFGDISITADSETDAFSIPATSVSATTGPTIVELPESSHTVSNEPLSSEQLKQQTVVTQQASTPPNLSKQSSTLDGVASTNSSTLQDMEKLLADLDATDDVDALLGEAGADGLDEDLLDLDDAELEDLENFLSPSSKKQ